MSDEMKRHFNAVKELAVDLLQQTPVPFRLMRMYVELLQELNMAMRVGTAGLNYADPDDDGGIGGIAIAGNVNRRRRHYAIDGSVGDPMQAVVAAAMPMLQAHHTTQIMRTIPHLETLYPDPVERERVLAAMRQNLNQAINGGAEQAPEFRQPPPLPPEL